MIRYLFVQGRQAIGSDFGPNIPIVGVPIAAAICIGPLSCPINPAESCMIAALWRSVVLPASEIDLTSNPD